MSLLRRLLAAWRARRADRLAEWRQARRDAATCKQREEEGE